MDKTQGGDAYWVIFKKPYDMAYYAKCNCGFYQPCYKQNYLEVNFDEYSLFNFCPKCGAEKKYYYFENGEDENEHE